MYRILLEAESEGILDDVDMMEVEKLILDPKTELESVGCPRDVEQGAENKRTKIKAESRRILHDVNRSMTEEENQILGPQAEMHSVGIQHDVDVVKQEEEMEDFELDKKWRLCGICLIFLILGNLLSVIYYHVNS